MNVIWIVADTFRRDHLGAYGDKVIRTPSLDALAARSMRFDRHYIGGFPTMPTRADHATGRFTMSFMGWEALPEEATTLAQILADAGYHTAAVVDTPFYWRHDMNFDRGFQTFFTVQGQEGSNTRVRGIGHHESRDIVAWWRKESDHNVAQTMIKAGDWLERHYKEDFFLYVDTWDPHEPWDAPAYYTELYMPDYDGEVVQPIYAHWQDEPGFTEAKVKKAAATYKGEVTMVDTWVGHLLRKVENMGHRGRHDDRVHVRPRFLLRRTRRPVRQDDVCETAGRQAVPTRRTGLEVGLLAAVRGSDDHPAAHTPSQTRARQLHRPDVGCGRDAHGARHAGSTVAVDIGRKVADAGHTGGLVVGPGVQREHDPVRQPGG